MPRADTAVHRTTRRRWRSWVTVGVAWHERTRKRPRWNLPNMLADFRVYAAHTSMRRWQRTTGGSIKNAEAHSRQTSVQCDALSKMHRRKRWTPRGPKTACRVLPSPIASDSSAPSRSVPRVTSLTCRRYRTHPCSSSRNCETRQARVNCSRLHASNVCTTTSSSRCCDATWAGSVWRTVESVVLEVHGRQADRATHASSNSRESWTVAPRGTLKQLQLLRFKAAYAVRNSIIDRASQA